MQTVKPGIEPRSIVIVLAVTAALLLVPLVAMQFTAEVVWTLSDFAVAGVLIAGAGMLYLFFASRTPKRGGRLLIGACVALVFALVWIEMAVGLFGSPIAGS